MANTRNLFRFSSDMSGANIAATIACAPTATVAFDWFDVPQLALGAVNRARSERFYSCTHAWP